MQNLFKPTETIEYFENLFAHVYCFCLSENNIHLFRDELELLPECSWFLFLSNAGIQRKILFECIDQIREAAKKVIFFNGRAIKVLPPPPEPNCSRNF